MSVINLNHLSTWILILGSLAGCATAPKVEKGVADEEKKLVLEQAEGLLQKASPADIREGLELLENPEIEDAAQAEQLASLAGALYRFLYPELGEDTLPLEPAPYTGPYQELLDRKIAAGEVSLGAVIEISFPISDEGFFDLVLPAFLLLHPQTEISPGDLQKLKARLNRAEELNPLSVLPPFLLGLATEREMETSQAESLYTQSFRRAESFYPGRLRLASLLLDSGYPGEAAESLEEVLQIAPGHGEARLLLARAYLEAGSPEQLEKAEALIAEEILRNLEAPEYLLLRARILQQKGQWYQALKPLDLVLKEHPQAAGAYLLKARILYEEALDKEGALDLLQEAGERFQEDARFPELIGKILVETGSTEDGLRKLNQALELDPNRQEALRLLLADAVRMERWLQASIYLARIIELCGEEDESDLLAAYRIYRNLGDQTQALYYAEKLYRKGSREVYTAMYARALLENEKEKEALVLIERGLEELEEARVLSELLFLKASLQAESETELELLRASLLRNPNNLEALLRMAELYLERKEYRRARLYLKQAAALAPENQGLVLQLRQVEAVLEAKEGGSP